MFETHTYDDPVVLDPAIRRRWTFLETSSAAAVLRSVCPAEWHDITEVLARTLSPEHHTKLPIDLGRSATTNLEKAFLRVLRGVMGTCPLLVVAATPATWNGKSYSAA